MALKLSQSMKQMQGLTMTPQLQQAIKLLTLTHMEVTTLISEELVENPLLEEVHNEIDPSQTEEFPQEVEARTENFDAVPVVEKDDFDWQNYVDSFNANNNSESSLKKEELDSEDSPNYENLVTAGHTLADHLVGQLGMEDLSFEERKIAETIVNNLNSDGYLELSLEEISKLLGLPIDQINEVRELIQRLEPVGCASLNLTDCLLGQAKIFEQRSPLVENIIRNYLGEIQKKDYQKISKLTGASLDSIKLAENVIKELHPRPGRLINSEQTHYVTPDIYVKEAGGEFVVQVNDEGVPRLRISKMYQDMLHKKSDKASREYVQEKIRAALWLIKSIQNRQKTIVRVAKAIVSRQQEFFRKGSKYLRPMVLKDIAEEIGMHESTVSRVTTNKFLYCALGVYELKYFFKSGFAGREGSEDVSSEALKLQIKKLIESENPKKPFSDQKIVDLLGRENIKVARRTVTKYREGLGIEASPMRKKSG